MSKSFFSRMIHVAKKEKGMSTTILARMLRLSFISILFFVVSILVIFNFSIKNMLTENYTEQVEKYAQAYSGTVSQWTKLIRQQIENNAANAAFVSPKSSIDERKELLNEAAASTEFKDFSIANADGTTYNDTDISDRDYFAAAMDGRTYISSPVVRKTDNSLTIMVGSKMNVEGFDGVLYGGLDVSFFSSILDDINLGKTGMGFIVDSEGTIIAHPDNHMVIEGVNPVNLAKEDSSYSDMAGVVEQMIKGESGTMVFTDPDGTEYLVGYCPVEGEEGWSIAVMLENHETTDGFNSALKTCITIIIILFVIDAFVNFAIASKMAYPVKLAAERLKKISEGDLSENEEYKAGRDETGMLISALETTREELNTYIGEIGEVLSGITQGNLDQSIDRDYTGDFVKIKDSLNGILGALNETFDDSSKASAELLEGAHQVEMASQALASASTEQASAVVQITSSIEGIARSTAENTKDVIRVNELTRTAKSEADTGNAQMEKMINAMSDISSSSQNIAKIMKVIDDISFQTNILALNASVEAARAGIHGRGFAVVAEEVRSLAAKSSEAATEIAEMIDDTIKKIEDGSNIAGVTAAELKKIVGDIDEIADIMENIAQMSKEQATSVDQVNIGIEQISAAVQNNSATSEECAASSVELAEHAEGLRKQIDYYNLR